MSLVKAQRESGEKTGYSVVLPFPSLWLVPQVHFNPLCQIQGLWNSFLTEQASSIHNIPQHHAEVSDAEVITLWWWQKQQNAHCDSAMHYTHHVSKWRMDRLCKATLLPSHRTAGNTSGWAELHSSLCRFLSDSHGSPSGSIQWSWGNLWQLTLCQRRVETRKDTTPWWGAPKAA